MLRTNKFKFAALCLTVTTVLFSVQLYAENERTLAVEDTVVTQHSTRVNGKKFSYQATTGTEPVWNKKGDAIASLFYTYYQKQ